MAKYDNIDFTPTDAMAAEAKRGLAWRKEHKRGGTAVGAARANQLVRKEKLSPSTVRRMHSFFSRHEVDKKGEGFSKGPSFPSAGRIAWALWGGDAGQSWARKKVAQMNRADGKKAEAELSQVIPMNGYQQRDKRVSKSVDVTEEMLAQIERVTGTAVSASDIVVFEASVANTRPLNKMGSIFNQGRITEDTLRQMAAALNAGEESVPLHTLHMQGGELPIGKVFQAEVIANAGEAELRAAFYVPASETSLVEKINLGIIDEVSVGLKSKQLLCSKCGFDYFSADAGFENLYSMTCDNGHTVGDDGTHVMLAGLDKWMELSLVSRGAASKPKILGRTKQVLGRETYDRIAADGLPPEVVVLFTASDEKEAPMPNDGTQVFDPQAEISALRAELAEIKSLLIADEDEEDEAEAEAEADAEAEDEDDEQAPAGEQPVAENSEQADEALALKAELDAAKARIAELEAAAAPKKEEVTIDVSGIPVGGVAASAVEDAKRAAAKPSLSAFKTPKR